MLTQDSLIHVTTRAVWDTQVLSGSYSPPGFKDEGFIHCCHLGQLQRVLRDHFSKAYAITLLVIDQTSIMTKIKYEPSPSTGQDYPHIYSVLDTSLVIEAIDITRHQSIWTVTIDLPRG